MQAFSLFNIQFLLYIVSHTQQTPEKKSRRTVTETVYQKIKKMFQKTFKKVKKKKGSDVQMNECIYGCVRPLQI